MEVSNARKPAVFVYEALGTALLLFAINMQNGGFFGPFGIALTIFACLLIGGPITGAHYNPSVTVGVYLANKKFRDDLPMFLVMLAAQVVGGIVGVMLVWASLVNNNAEDHTDAGVPTSEVALLLPNDPDVSKLNIFMIEMVCSLVFVMINLVFKIGKTSPTNERFLACFAVALTLLAMICVSGPKTGACLNPAVALAQTMYEVIQFGPIIPTESFEGRLFRSYLAVYILGPLTGGVFAGLAHIGHQYCHDKIHATPSAEVDLAKVKQQCDQGDEEEIGRQIVVGKGRADESRNSI